jgi:hypothetical protein
VFPSDAAVDVPVSLSFRWNRSEGASTYRFQLSRSLSFSSTLLDTAGLSDTTFAQTGLQGTTGYYWRVRASNNIGDGFWSAPFRFTTAQFVSVAAGQSVPAEFSLGQNHPNPFNPATTIGFSLPQAHRVTIKVFDILGQEVATLLDEEVPAGSFTVTWNATKAASGIYFYRIVAGDFVQTKRMVLMR